jgi:acyl-CoA synthetase (AMP-forming)/AMP-acid ligase II
MESQSSIIKDAAEFSTLVELLRRRALQQPGHELYSFLPDGENESGRLTCSDLDEQARAIGATLQRQGAAGQRVLLVYPPGLEFISSFFGCLYAGAVAVPMYPPRPNRSFDRARLIVSDAQAGFALTTAAILSKMKATPDQSAWLKDARWMATDELDRDATKLWRPPAIDGDSPAFLQYTSGSTAAPKGVMVSHRNLLNNQRLIRQAFQQSENSVIVGWLPLYHDMGLIGNALQPLYTGARCILMPPPAFHQTRSSGCKPSRAIERRPAAGRTSLTTCACARFPSNSALRYALTVGKWPSTERSRRATPRWKGSQRRSRLRDFAAKRSIRATDWPKRRCSSPAAR